MSADDNAVWQCPYVNGDVIFGKVAGDSREGDTDFHVSVNKHTQHICHNNGGTTTTIKLAIKLTIKLKTWNYCSTTSSCSKTENKSYKTCTTVAAFISNNLLRLVNSYSPFVFVSSLSRKLFKIKFNLLIKSLRLHQCKMFGKAMKCFV